MTALPATPAGDAPGAPVPLTAILDLRATGPATFRRPARPGRSRRMFGGEAVGQAIVAAGRTAGDGWSVVAAQGQFLRSADTARPVDYRVERVRDGRTFGTRRVDAVQDGRTVFQLTATLQEDMDEDDAQLSHQQPGPEVPGPEELPDPEELFADDPDNLAWVRGLLRRSPVECRFAGLPTRAHGAHGVATEPRQRVWVRVPGLPAGPPQLHRAALGYLSDLFLAATGAAPHGRTIQDAGLRVASLDHSLWFRGQPDVGEWLLYDQSSPWSGAGRALCTGTFYDRAGRLVADVGQAVLLQRRPVGGTGRIR